VEYRIKNQSGYECDLILDSELDFKRSDVSFRDLLHFIFDAYSVVFN